MVDAASYVCNGVICVSSEYIIDGIIYQECVLDIIVLEKICDFSYQWVVISEDDPFVAVGRCVTV